jgi:hypothetical protein
MRKAYTGAMRMVVWIRDGAEGQWETVVLEGGEMVMRPVIRANRVLVEQGKLQVGELLNMLGRIKPLPRPDALILVRGWIDGVKAFEYFGPLMDAPTTATITWKGRDDARK